MAHANVVIEETDAGTASKYESRLSGSQGLFKRLEFTDHRKRLLSLGLKREAGGLIRKAGLKLVCSYNRKRGGLHRNGETQSSAGRRPEN